jgi:hypothetical protein
MKPFLFVRKQKNYARFAIPKDLRRNFGNKKTLTFALGSAEKSTIRLRAAMLECELLNTIREAAMNFDDIDLSKIRTYEIDLSKGIFKSTSKEDHQNLLATLEVLGSHKALSLPKSDDILEAPSRIVPPSPQGGAVMTH